MVVAGWYGCGAGRDDTPGVGSGVGVPRPMLPMLTLLLPGVSSRSGGSRGLLGDPDSGDGLKLWNAGGCCPAVVGGSGGSVDVDVDVIDGGGAEVV